MIIVTGGAGFVGSNMVKGLNDQGYSRILVVDNMGQGTKFKNLVPLKFADYADKQEFLQQIVQGKFDSSNIEAIFHIGACSDTMEKNGNYMMQNNFEYSKMLLNFCLRRKIPFIYASSASVYGNGENGFFESDECEGALNVYAFSKMMFDRYVTANILPGVRSQVVGLRYFNVFGPQENHKGRMASIIYQLYHQVTNNKTARLFAGTDGYGNGEQRRDFIYVKDVVNVNLHFLANPQVSGVFNCGTGKARSFNDVAHSIINAVGDGKIEYVPFPEELQGKYQSYTEADVKKLRASGYTNQFTQLEAAVAEYCDYLKSNNGYLR